MLVCQRLTSLEFFLIWNNIFPILGQFKFVSTSEIRPGDLFSPFLCKYVPFVAFVQYFMTSTVVLVC